MDGKTIHSIPYSIGVRSRSQIQSLRDDNGIAKYETLPGRGPGQFFDILFALLTGITGKTSYIQVSLGSSPSAGGPGIAEQQGKFMTGDSPAAESFKERVHHLNVDPSNALRVQVIDSRI